jgi:hypothetical protein
MSRAVCLDGGDLTDSAAYADNKVGVNCAMSADDKPFGTMPVNTL